MNKSLQDASSLAARLLIVVMFLPAGVSKLTAFEATVGYIASAGLPLAAAGAALAIAIEVFGSLALIAGFGTRMAAGVLAGFTLLASVFFHAYWAVPQDQVFVTQLLFFKNIAITGGLLALMAHGGGGWSLDAWRSFRRSGGPGSNLVRA